jgi:ADP-ribosylglycohydrolase
MLGGIIGDIVGSVYEGAPIKQIDFPLFGVEATFTDDTVLAVATADALLHDHDYARAYRRYFQRHPDRGYGGGFRHWAAGDDTAPYNSFGNGSAMRVGPVGWAFDDAPSVLSEAKRSAEVTHNHPEGIRGAQAVALGVWLARQGNEREAIRQELTSRFGYDLDRRLEDIRPGYRFDATCQGSVPEALIAFFEAESYEQAIRNAVSLGGDSDTQACISGYLAEAHFGIPPGIRKQGMERLAPDLAQIVRAFAGRFGIPI